MTRIAYLMNTYPITSTTFIRREIRAIEAAGHPVTRFAVRRWSEPLVDAADREEQDRTKYLLSGRAPRLIRDFLAETVSNPRGMARAVAGCWRLWRNARRNLVAHVAYLMEAASLRRAAADEGIDHIHAHFSTNACGVAMLCHRMGGPGYSFTVHGPTELRDVAGQSLAMKTAESRFAVAITHYARVRIALAAGMAHWDKIHIVGCGIDTAEFAPSTQAFAPDAPFVSIGRLCPQKAQVLVVRAVAEVAGDHPGVRVILVGDGESRADVEAEIARLGMDRHIDVLGWQDNSRVRELLSGARALLLPSFAEGLPVGIMESLALGRPAISTFIAGIPELVDRDCGWIIPAGSVSAIADAMRQALETPPEDLARMGAVGRARVEERHDITRNATRLRDLILTHAERVS